MHGEFELAVLSPGRVILTVYDERRADYESVEGSLDTLVKRDQLGRIQIVRKGTGRDNVALFVGGNRYDQGRYFSGFIKDVVTTY